MTRHRAMQLLAQCKPDLEARFGITRLVLFGSIATSTRYFGVQFYLEDMLGCPIDLVTDKALCPELRPRIEKEGLHV